MKSFAKEFLRDEPPGGERQIFLGAFGKHPGWDDHIDDIGLETESLVTAKQLLYVEGIGGQIGAWEQLDWAAQVAFNHVFIWRREKQLLVGRMWTSSDGKKRTRYPMVVCAHCIGASLPLVLDTLLAWLEELQARAMATKSAEEVRVTMAQFRDGLRNWLAAAEEDPARRSFEPEAFLADIGFSQEDESLLKALWHLHGSEHSAGKSKGKAGATPEGIRLQASSASTARSLEFWNQMAACELDPSAPVLLVMPAQQYWLDVIAGEPTPPDFFCLRASPRALPLSCDATELPEDCREKARAIMEHALTGETAGVGQGSRSWMSRLFGG